MSITRAFVLLVFIATCGCAAYATRPSPSYLLRSGTHVYEDRRFDHGLVIAPGADIDSLIFRRCVWINVPEPAVRAPWKEPCRINYLELVDNVVMGGRSGFHLWCEAENILASGNTVSRLQGPGDVIGMAFGAPFDSSVAAIKSVTIAANTIAGLTTTAPDSVRAVVQGISFIGRRGRIVGNTIAYLDGQWGDTEGIYTKALYAQIQGNRLVNAGGWQGMISLKGKMAGEEGEPHAGDCWVLDNEILSSALYDSLSGCFAVKFYVSGKAARNAVRGTRGIVADKDAAPEVVIEP